MFPLKPNYVFTLRNEDNRIFIIKLLRKYERCLKLGVSIKSIKSKKKTYETESNQSDFEIFSVFFKSILINLEPSNYGSIVSFNFKK